MLKQRVPVSPPLLLGLVLAGLVVLAALAARGLPLLRWGYDVTRGSQALEQALAWPEPRRIDSLPQARDPAALARARDYLQRATRIWPSHPYAYRLLGRSFLADAAWQPAVEALTQARDRAPRHPLIGWELGLAHEQAGQSEQQVAAWQRAGLDALEVAARGEEALANEDEAAARRWYDRALALNASRAFPVLFRRLVLDLRSQSPRADELLAQLDPTGAALLHPVEATGLTLDGAALRWLPARLPWDDPGRYAAPPLTVQGTSAELGPGTVLVLVAVEQAGPFAWEVALHAPDEAAAEVALGLSGRTVQTVHLEAAGEQRVTVPLTLGAGRHTLDITVKEGRVRIASQRLVPDPALAGE